MQHPRHEILAAKTQANPQRIAGIAFVALLHVAVIYALMSGLAMRIVKQLPHNLTAQVIPLQQEKPTPPPPQPQLQKPQLPTVAPPEVQIQTQAAPQIAVQTAPPQPAAPTNPSPISTQATGVTSTHTTPPYPEVERRMGHQGTVTLRVSIGTDGSVTGAQVEKSSGFPALDQAAVDWVTRHWKYKPAIQNGQPVASTSDAAVVFNLKNAR